eukprot:352421-Chlamydomonas_euryale.AAC.85
MSVLPQIGHETSEGSMQTSDARSTVAGLSESPSGVVVSATDKALSRALKLLIKAAGDGSRGRYDDSARRTFTTSTRGSKNNSTSLSSCHTSWRLRYSKLMTRVMRASWYTKRIPQTRSSTLLRTRDAHMQERV